MKEKERQTEENKIKKERKKIKKEKRIRKSESAAGSRHRLGRLTPRGAYMYRHITELCGMRIENNTRRARGAL